jgi:hypothetical protein
MANVTPVFLIQRAVLVPQDDSRGFVALDIPDASPEAVAEALVRWRDSTSRRGVSLLLIAEPEGMEHVPVEEVAPVGDRALRAHVLELAGESTPVASSSEMLGWAVSQIWPNGALNRAFLHYESQPFLRIIIERLAAERIHVRGAVSWWALACRMAGEEQSSAKGGKTRAKKPAVPPTAALLVANKGVLSAVIQPTARRFMSWMPPESFEIGVSNLMEELGAREGAQMWGSGEGAKPRVHILALTESDVRIDGGRAIIQTWDSVSIGPLLKRPFPAFANLLENFPKTYRLDAVLMGVAGLGLALTLFFGLRGWLDARAAQVSLAQVRAHIADVQAKTSEAGERKTKIERIEQQFSVETFTIPRGKPDAVQAIGRSLPAAFTVSFLELNAENRWRLEGFILSRESEQSMRQAADQVRDALNAHGFLPYDRPEGFVLDARDGRVVAEGEWRPVNSSPTRIPLIELVGANNIDITSP